jgi:hypothetical protein
LEDHLRHAIRVLCLTNKNCSRPTVRVLDDSRPGMVRLTLDSSFGSSVLEFDFTGLEKQVGAPSRTRYTTA